MSGERKGEKTATVVTIKGVIERDVDEKNERII